MPISDDTKFGLCRGCNTLVQRDDMRAMMVLVYAQAVSKTEQSIRVRFCPKCFAEMVSDLKEIEWDSRLYAAKEIRTSESLSAICPEVEYAEDEAAMRAIGKL